ncbi:hypothetical protein ABZ854_36470, partial [Streptomyces sp. NPDC047028]
MRITSRTYSRRGALALGAGAAAAASLTGCGSSTSSDGGGGAAGSGHGSGGADGKGGGKDGGERPAKLIGDGSTSFTGRQPHQPAKPEPLEPGQTPP